MGVLIGCDIEKTERFVRLLKKESFLKGVYTPGEQEFIAAHSQPYRAAAWNFLRQRGSGKSAW